MRAVLWRKWRSFLSMPLGSQVLVPVVWLLLGIARAIILLIPFRYFSTWLGQGDKTNTYTPLLTVAQIEWARRMGRVVRVSAPNTPWESLCFPQALVACLLLRLAGIPYIMHFGLAKHTESGAGDPLKAHAWVTAGPVAVTGGRNNLFKFTVVGSYTSPLLARELI